VSSSRRSRCSGGAAQRSWTTLSWRVTLTWREKFGDTDTPAEGLILEYEFKADLADYLAPPPGLPPFATWPT